MSSTWLPHPPTLNLASAFATVALRLPLAHHPGELLGSYFILNNYYSINIMNHKHVMYMYVQ